MRILSVFGTRPEAIKMAPLVRALHNTPSVTSLVCVSGQHRDMVRPVLRLFEIEPDYDLALMKADQSLNGLMAASIGALDRLIGEAKPDRILVHGDTTTALAGALAGFHRGVPVGHVEAGLRTHDMARPWPEEMNRRVVDIASDLLFAPTPASKANLEREALQGRVLVTGHGA